MAEHFDAAVIGAGQAGPSLVNRLTQAGKKVAVVERKRFGGTCVNTGCTPTKTMVASAYAARIVARADDYGVSIDGKITIDMLRVMARKDKIVNTASTRVGTWLEGMPNCTVYRSSARLTSATTLDVGGESISADMIFLDVGARPVVPKIPGIETIATLTNENVMDLEAVPAHLVILGGSYIGLEFAQMFRRFGAEVTIIEAAPRLLPREDEDISASIHEILEGEGILIHTDAKCSGLAKKGANIVATMETPNGRSEISGSHLLVAVGRRPNTDGLGLEAAGVKVNP